MIVILTCALAITSTSQTAVDQLTIITTTSVAAPAITPAWKKANGIPRNPVPRMKFTTKKNPKKMFTVLGGLVLSLLVLLHGLQLEQKERKFSKAFSIIRRLLTERLEPISFR